MAAKFSGNVPKNERAASFFSKFKIAAAAMLDFGHRMFSRIVDVLLFRITR
jgi:hypothetical protein